MISAEVAVMHFRRDLILGTLLKGLLMGCAVLAMFLNYLSTTHGGDGSWLLFAVVVAWMVLSYRSARGSRLVAQSWALLAAGRYQQAESSIEAALGSFSIFRGAKMDSMRHLALLRHNQRRWQESATLCRGLLSARLGSMRGIAKPVRLILADSLLELGDLRGAYGALVGLYHQRLTLGEGIHLMGVQVDYESRIGAWAQMLPPGSAAAKVQLAEMMPAEIAARTEALLALAAAQTGQTEWAEWLRRRVELLADVPELVARRPVLAQLWPGHKV